MKRVFACGCDGNVAVSFAIIAPALIIAAGVAIDLQQRLGQKAALQDAADNLALRGAREMLLENAKAATIEALIGAWADAQYASALGDFAVVPDVDDTAKTASVRLTQGPRKGFFLSTGAGPVEASATAQAHGVTNVCVIALEESGDGAIAAASGASIDAPECAILSNSTSTRGIDVSGAARLRADLICSAGGAAGGSLHFDPLPVTDCPVYQDPLASRVAPDVGACDHVDLKIGEPPSLASFLLTALAATIATIDGSLASTLIGYERHDLEPGVYCGGLDINDKSDVHLAPGVYVIKDGPLNVAFGARLYGENVGFYLDGADSTFTFEPASIIHLTAPADGLMAGLLFFESRQSPPGRTHSVLSSNARELLGTIYLPKGEFRVDSLMPIADQSAYTAIVAGSIAATGSPRLVLNADYSETNVPVPDGIGPTGGQVFLRE